MDELKQKMLKRVQGLLAKAEDEACTPQEAEALTVKAAELMTRYGIDRALAAARADKREIPIDKVVTFSDPYRKQHMHLYYNILLIFGGEAVMTPDRKALHVFAFEADLATVDILYTSLLLQATHQLQRAHVPYYDNARSFRVAWWIGFTNEIVIRLKAVRGEAQKEASAKSPGTDIVLRDRALEVQSAFRAVYSKVRKGVHSRSLSREGFYDGTIAGKNADLHDRSNVGQKRRCELD